MIWFKKNGWGNDSGSNKWFYSEWFTNCIPLFRIGTSPSFSSRFPSFSSSRYNEFTIIHSLSSSRGANEIDPPQILSVVSVWVERMLLTFKNWSNMKAVYVGKVRDDKFLKVSSHKLLAFPLFLPSCSPHSWLSPRSRGQLFGSSRGGERSNVSKWYGTRLTSWKRHKYGKTENFCPSISHQK